MNAEKIKTIDEMESKFDFKFNDSNKFHISLFMFYSKTGFLTEKQIYRIQNPLIIDTSRGFSSDLDKEYQMSH